MRFIHAALSLLLFVCWMSPRPVGAESQPVRIGVLAFRSLEQTTQRWQPTAEYLQNAIPHRNFVIQAMFYDELDQAVINGAVDFVLTNPEHYISLRSSGGLSAIATLMPSINGHPVTSFGGVILTMADRADIRSLDDLNGKTIASPAKGSFGGYLTQSWEMTKQGVSADHFIFTGMPHDNAVFMLLTGKADAAFVRTGIYESMVREGTLPPQQVKIINRQPDGQFPEIRSTDLYPEWAFVALKQTSEATIKDVAMALMHILPTDAAAQQGKYYGFSPPGDYAPVEALMLRLRVHPNRMLQFNFQDVLTRYMQPIIGLIVALLVAAAGSCLYLLTVNRRLKRVSAESLRLTDELRTSILQLQQSKAELERFGTIAAHDLQEPIRSIVSFVQLLDRRYGSTFDAEGQQFMGYITVAAKRMRDLVGDLLTYTHCLRTEMRQSAVDSAVIARRAADRILSHGKHQSDSIQIDPLPMVMGDAMALTQVFHNLIDNGLKFSAPDRPARIHISARQVDGMWRFSVQDNGIGIDPRYHDQLFTVFKRLHPAHSYEGTGLGLSICRQIIGSHGGRIWVDSVIPDQGGSPQGTIIHFTVPTVPGQA